jgi:hydroxymethylbilane synthase
MTKVKSKTPAPVKKTATKKATAPVPSTTKKAAPATSAKKVAPTATAKKASPGNFDFIGMFPIRKNKDSKKIDPKKQATGPVFEKGSYSVATLQNALGAAFLTEMREIYKAKHGSDGLSGKEISLADSEAPVFSTIEQLIQRLAKGEFDMVIANVKDIPLVLPESVQLAAVLRREDPRDVLITKSTYGAIQELPRASRVLAGSRRRLMQVRALRDDIQFISTKGLSAADRLRKLDTDEADALILAWATLKRLNISPRFYVSLQSEVMLPAPCQGSVGVLCRGADENLLAKLRYVEDSEASWASRCERAFLLKMGGKSNSPIGALAHRKGTQDPWILDIVVGDANSGELLRHREIGTSRCKPESLADKAFSGVLAKGARKFLWP